MVKVRRVFKRINNANVVNCLGLLSNDMGFHFCDLRELAEINIIKFCQDNGIDFMDDNNFDLVKALEQSEWEKLTDKGSRVNDLIGDLEDTKIYREV